ncbi:acyltransferase family protein [Methylobrevis pamukkalensis]|uniref:Acyltransferase family protein n=1 Tax=Methylobrevis pamukkalensis TaxID=1439726 RepID=A0A1E3H4X9_9HYPH|nr:acyltransferase [Methylobrevis pamukkalensis]ODN71383.1 Acyltransferase family protein [Methylobrevis pamukkalensis]
MNGALFEPSFFGHYSEPVGPFKIVASFLGLIDKANPPTWSIFVELIASALLPFFVLYARDLTRAAVLSAGLLVVSFAMPLLPETHLFLYRWPAFMVNFAVGILALHVALQLRPQLARLPASVSLVASVGLFFVLMNGRALMDAAGYTYSGHADPVTNLFEMAVSMALIVLLLEAAPKLATTRPLKILGDLSYGIYLIHFPMLFTVAAGLVLLFGADLLAAHSDLFALSLAIVTTLAVLVASALAWRFLEKPMIDAGRRLSNRIDGR